MENISENDDNKFAEKYCDEVLSRIKIIMEQKDVSQGMLAAKSGLGQSTVSKFLSGDIKVSLIHIAKICRALEIDPGVVLSPDRYQQDNGPASLNMLNDHDDDTLIYNPARPAFKGYLREFQVYFNSTISSENNILDGTLTFSPSKDGRTCIADMILNTGKKKSDGTNVTKHYTGTLVISISMSACYCTLLAKDIGEICFLVFHHMFLFHEDLICRLACAVTVSSGGNKRPTMHRLLISREKLNVSNPQNEDFKFIKGQLLLNSSEIMIKRSSYEKMRVAESEWLDSEDMKDLLDEFDQMSEKQDVYFIDESKIRNASYPMGNKVRLISLLREYSINERYNKISTKADEHVYHYLEEKNLI